MSAVSTSVLLTLVLFIHSSDAITCYVCRSKGEPACDDPFRNSTSIHTLKCPSNACLKLQGTTKRKKRKSYTHTGLSAPRLMLLHLCCRSSFYGFLARVCCFNELLQLMNTAADLVVEAN